MSDEEAQAVEATRPPPENQPTQPVGGAMLAMAPGIGAGRDMTSRHRGVTYNRKCKKWQVRGPFHFAGVRYTRKGVH